MSYNIIPYRILPYHMLLHHTVTYHTIPYQIICTCIKCPFFALWQAFLFRPRIFSRALGCGARGGGACALRCNFWPRPGSEAHVLGVRSRASWLLFTGLLFATPSLPRTMETRHTRNQQQLCGNAATEDVLLRVR